MPLAALQERMTRIASAAEAQPPDDNFTQFLPADYFRDGLPDLASQEGRDLSGDPRQPIQSRPWPRERGV
jgi:hypothetical protein